MSEALTHFKSQADMTYLGSWDIPNVDGIQKDLVLTIKSVGMEVVENPTNNTKETKRVIHFEENGYKPMVVNTTNATAIAAALGSPYIEKWVGRQISIFSLHGKWFGKEQDALRVRDKAPMMATCEECKKPVMGNRRATVEDLVAMSKKNCDGKVLCIACMTKWKEKNQKGN